MCWLQTLTRTRAEGVVSTQMLAEELNVSELTVRRDLKVMADEGLLVRTRGGASMRGSLAQELSYLEKTAEAHREKVLSQPRPPNWSRPGTL